MPKGLNPRESLILFLCVKLIAKYSNKDVHNRQYNEGPGTYSRCQSDVTSTSHSVVGHYVSLNNELCQAHRKNEEALVVTNEDHYQEAR